MTWTLTAVTNDKAQLIVKKTITTDPVIAKYVQNAWMLEDYIVLVSIEE